MLIEKILASGIEPIHHSESTIVVVQVALNSLILPSHGVLQQLVVKHLRCGTLMVITTSLCAQPKRVRSFKFWGPRTLVIPGFYGENNDNSLIKKLSFKFS